MSTVSLASSAADSEALASIERHHAELVGGLSAQTSALVAAVRAGDGWQDVRDALVTWCRAELLPHADAEEAVLYPAGRGVTELEALIRGMSHEHALLGDLVALLGAADDAPAALVLAGGAQTVFEAHVAKENDLLLPAMAATRSISVARLLDDLEAELERRTEHAAVTPATPSERGQPVDGHGHTCGCHEDDAGAPPELDARIIPHEIRHATIFGALDAVAPGSGLVLVAPHDPLPLLAQIEQRAPSAFEVEYVQRGPEAWRLRFTRMPRPAA